jgi:hypothetical protein
VDFDWGFQEGRQWGRGRSGGQVAAFSPLSLSLKYEAEKHFFAVWSNVGGFSYRLLIQFGQCDVLQVRDEYRTDYDPDILFVENHHSWCCTMVC